MGKGALIMPGEVTGAQAVLMQQAFGKRSNGSGRRRKKRAKRGSGSAGGTRKRRTRSTSRTSRGGSRRGKLKKGSAAAKRYMARLRRMRK